MTPDPAPTERLLLTSRVNLRDLGGLPTGAGQVRPGVLFRAGEPRDLSPDEATTLTGLGITTVLDLRTEHEMARRPLEPLPGAVRRHLDVLGPDAAAGPARLEEVLSDPARSTAELGGGGAHTLFEDAYREFVSGDRARAAYRSLLEILSEADGPTLFHCTAGKDRTGWAAALVLSLLGTPRAVIKADYLLTNAAFAPAYRVYREPFVAAGGEAEVMDAVLEARTAYLDAAFEELERSFGDVETYVRRGLGVEESVVARVRARLVISAASRGTGPRSPSRPFAHESPRRGHSLDL